MKRFLSIFVFLGFLTMPGYLAVISASVPGSAGPQDDYLITNGRIWRNQYLGIKGNPYFLSGEFLYGDITFNGKKFTDRVLRYDIYNDEVVMWVNNSVTIFLNKEMVDEFDIYYQGEKHHIVNMGEGSDSLLSGYVNVYYDGPTPLYVKYRKEIEILAVDNKYDLFVQVHRIYLKKDDLTVQIKSLRKLYETLIDKKAELKDFVRKSHQRIIRKEPGSFIPLLEYYDKIRQ